MSILMQSNAESNEIKIVTEPDTKVLSYDHNDPLYSRDETQFTSYTCIVEEIIKRVIVPSKKNDFKKKLLKGKKLIFFYDEMYTQTSTLNQNAGVLLLGPPGTGKTFAVKAIKKHCASWCKVLLSIFSEFSFFCNLFL